MRARRALSVLACLVAAALPAVVHGQSKGVVRGTVTDAITWLPVEGARVSVLGSPRVSVTGAGGEFELEGVATGSGMLRVERAGYRTTGVSVVVPADGVSVRVSPAAVTLDELVVTGQPEATRKRAVGASVATIDAEALDRAPVTSLAQLLQSRQAGVTGIGASGTVGTASSLVLRGLTSVDQSNAPVVYVDGVRVDASEKANFYFSLGGQSTSRLQDINPADIERVEVVKGAAASALYGTEASNGVIQIFTKRGRPGATTLSASVRVGSSRIPDVLPGLHPDPQYPSPNDVLDSGRYQQYTVSLRGGTERLRHYLSTSYQDEDGSFPGNAFKRGTVRANLWLMPYENVTAELSSGLAWSEGTFPFNDTFGYGVLFNLLNANPAVRGTAADPYGGPFLPVPYAMEVSNVDETYRFTQGLTLEHELGAGFSQRATLGIDVVNGTGTTVWPYAPNRFTPKGARWVAQRDNVNVNADYAASLNTRLSDAVESTLSIGGQLYTSSDHRYYAAGSDFPAPGLELLGATSARIEVNEEALSYRTGGLFVQEQLGFGDRFFLTGGVRVDGSSAFGEDFGFQPYPKAGASYVVSDEAWFGVPGVSSLRVRAGYGMAGTQPGAFDAIRTYTAFTAHGGQPAIHAGAIGNPDLAPEVSHEYEGGFDAGLFQDRVALSVTGYRQTTTDALLSRPVAPSLGYLARQLVNVGEIRNVGAELSLDATVLQTRRASWSVRANYAYNRNDVVDLGGATPLTVDNIFGARVVEGYPLGGKWQFVQTGVDARGYPVRSDTAVYLGTGVPPHNGGLGSTLRVGGFELFANAQWAAGHVVTNRTRSYMLRFRAGEEYFDAVIANSDSPTAPKTDPVKQLLARAEILGEYTEPGDWLKLRELGASYTLPERLSRPFGAKAATLTVSGRNLWTLTGYSGPDPEVSASLVPAPISPSPYFLPGSRQHSTYLLGNDFFTVPQPRTVVVGVDVQF